jgi:hypothetical protein
MDRQGPSEGRRRQSALSRHLVVPTAMLFSTFAWSFTFVSLPFHVRELSTLDAAATLRWTGWIIGITNVCVPLASRASAPGRVSA